MFMMSRRQVMLIDEPGVVRDSLARLLVGEGYDVEVADVAKAGKRIEEGSPDAIIFDGDFLEKTSPTLASRLSEPGEGALRIELRHGTERRSLEEASDGQHVVLPRPVNLEDLRLALWEKAGRGDVD